MQTYDFDFSLAGSDVAKDDGVIRGVSVITSGVQARGHNLEVDETTLLQMLDCAQKKGKVKVKWNHRTGADAINGNLRNFRLDDGKLKADWHLLKSHPSYAHALELAKEMPEEVGLSASFGGLSELQDGTKVHEPDATTKHQYVVKNGLRLPCPAGKQFARCTNLVSVDLVADPAANPNGLFEARVDSPDQGMSENAGTQTGADTQAKEFSLADVMAGINNLNAGLQQLAQRTQALEEFATDLDQAGHELEEQQAGADQNQQFSSMEDAVRYLENRLQQVGDEREQAEQNHAFDVLEGRVNQLLELNSQLTNENSAMAQAIHEFEAHTSVSVQFAAGTDGALTPHVMVQDEGENAPCTEFEARCKELEAGGKDEPTSIRLAMKENPGRYQKHLQALGVIAREL